MGAKRKTKKRKRSGKFFESFKQTATDVFEFLTTDFGFSHVGVSEWMPDCVITYQNQTTGIKVGYEWESQLGVTVVRLERNATEVSEGKGYDLLFLMGLRKPQTNVHNFYGADKEWTNSFIEDRLRDYANFLKEDARDILTGDFSVFPELKKLSAHRRRQTNKEYFGTYCGESPRFSEHPTLAQIFTGATDIDPELKRLFGDKLSQDKTQFRIYEAYWDHQYSVREIAEFLNRNDRSIKQELEDFDDHL